MAAHALTSHRKRTMGVREVTQRRLAVQGGSRCQQAFWPQTGAGQERLSRFWGTVQAKTMRAAVAMLPRPVSCKRTWLAER